jgi:hypothetical protein
MWLKINQSRSHKYKTVLGLRLPLWSVATWVSQQIDAAVETI